MARGRFSDTFQISTNTDTLVIPAPSASPMEAVYVFFVGISVSAAGTTSRVKVENGAGGDVIFRMATTGADTYNSTNFATGLSAYSGYRLADATGLNVNTSGAAAATIDVQVIWEVR